MLYKRKQPRMLSVAGYSRRAAVWTSLAVRLFLPSLISKETTPLNCCHDRNPLPRLHPYQR